MTVRSALRSILHAIALVALLAASAPAVADAPASVAGGDENARASFQRFARDWMGKFKKIEAENRLKPQVQATSGGTTSTYRGYGDDFSIELRPTGHATAPYIGLLRYEERLYSCVEERCSVASTAPVTEIFRFQNGKWQY